jgi:hypothetical protein
MKTLIAIPHLATLGLAVHAFSCLSGVVAAQPTAIPPGTALACINGGPGPSDDGCETCPCPDPPGLPGGGGRRGGYAEGNPPGKGLQVVGDPISIGHGYVNRSETDFSLSVLYGLDLTMSRLYSSSGAAYEVYVYSGDSMLGPNWFCPYEMHLEADDFDEFDEPINYILIDENGQFHHLESGAYTGWRARLDQGSPFTLTKTGSGSSASYVLKGTGYREWGFNADGKVTYYEANTNTTQQERLTFTYDGSDRLWKVTAPGSDGRYLEFLYNNGTFTRRCTSVKLAAGSNNYALMEYTYDGSGRLAAVKKNPTYASSTNEVQTLYDYGSFDLVSGSESWTSGSFLGKVSYRVNQESSPYRPLVAYKYRTGFDAPFVSKEFVYDVGATPSIWKQTLTLELYAWDHTTSIYYGDDTSDPATYFVTDYKCDVADMTYGSSTPKMPPTHFFGADDTGAGGSGGADKARLFGSVKLQDSVPSWYSLWEADYDLANSDYMLRYRQTKVRKYSTSSSTSKMETINTFHSTFKESISSVANPEGETASYAYGVLYYIPSTSIIDYGYGQLAQTTSPDGRSTSYTYHLASSGYPAGLLAAVQDHYGNVTSFEYDSRGNVPLK